MTDRMRELLLQYADSLERDDTCTDGFIGESVTFEETLKLMEEVAAAVRAYVRAGAEAAG